MDGLRVERAARRVRFEKVVEDRRKEDILKSCSKEGIRL